MSSCIVQYCNTMALPDNVYCREHYRPAGYVVTDDQLKQHNEDEIIVPSEDDVDEELLTSAFKLSAADLLRKAKKQGIITPTSEYAGIPAA